MSPAYKRGDPLLNRKPLFLVVSRLISVIVIILGWPILKFLYGFRIKGRISKHSLPAILISNHCLPLDPLLQGLALFPRFTYFTLLEETVLTPILGTLVRLLGGIPLPPDPSRLPDIEQAVKTALDTRQLIHFYPEGECFLLNQDVKIFKAGAFYYAIVFQVPLIPLVTVIKKKRRFRASTIILPPIQPPPRSATERENIRAAIHFARRVQAQVQTCIDTEGGNHSLYRGPMPRIKGVNDRTRG